MTSEELAKRIRIDAIKMVNHAHASHIGSVLSCVDIVAVLYSDVMLFDPNNPRLPGRDRLVLSKGHSGVAIYSALAEVGFFSPELLSTYGDNGSMFSCHVSHKKVPGVEVSTGSLGHGVCVACGMALDAKLKHKEHHVYCIVGDGECNEGSVWEMALFSSQYHLNNFTIIIDRNNMQAMGDCKDIIDTEPLKEKWSSFGWHAVVVNDGNDHDQLRNAFEEKNGEKPKVIIAKTIKGKGVSFMENNLLWHYRDPQGESFEKAIHELEATV